MTKNQRIWAVMRMKRQAYEMANDDSIEAGTSVPGCIMGKPLPRVGFIDDYYVLGIVCGLTGLTKLVSRYIKSVRRHDTQKNHLWDLGHRQCEDYSVSDIVDELARIRESAVINFDGIVMYHHGIERLKEIHTAIANIEYLRSIQRKKARRVMKQLLNF